MNHAPAETFFRSRDESEWASVSRDKLARLQPEFGDLLLHSRGDLKLFLVYGRNQRFCLVPPYDNEELCDWWESPETQADDMIRYATRVDYRKSFASARDCAQKAARSLAPEQSHFAQSVHDTVTKLIREPVRDEQTRRLLSACLVGLERGSFSHETNLAGSAFKALATAAIMYLDGMPLSSLVHPCANSVFNAARAVACTRGFLVEEDSFLPDEAPEFVDDEAAFAVSREFSPLVRRYVPLSVVACAAAGEPDPFPVRYASTDTWGAV